MIYVELGTSVDLVTKGTTPTTLGKHFTESGVKFLRAQNVINGRVLLDEEMLFIDASTHKNELKRSQIQEGDVLLTIAGTIGRTAIVETDEQLNCNQAIAIIRLGNSKIEPKYLCHYIASNDAQSQFNKGKVTATIANLSLGQVKKLSIPLPSLEEQKKIAAILDAADEYRQKTKALIDKYDQLTQSLFLEMFGDPVTNPMGWEKDTLKNCTNKIGSGATPRGGKEAYKEQGISLIRSLNIHDNWFKNKDLAFIDDSQASELNGVIVNANDIMFNITGASVCRCCIVPQSILPARVNQHVAIIRTKTEIINSTFLLHAFLSQNVKSHLLAIGGMGGATREALTKSDLETFKTIMPPINYQNRFAERVTQIEKQKQQAEASLVKAEELFSSLLQRAFKGDLT